MFSNPGDSPAASNHPFLQPLKQRGFHAPQESDDDEYDEGNGQSDGYMDEDEDLRQSLTGDYTDRNNNAMEEDAPYEEDEDMNDYQSRARSNGYDRGSNSDMLLDMGNVPGCLSQVDHMQLMKEPFSATARPSIFGKIAKDMYTRMGIPSVEESDDLILETETIITNLYEEGVQVDPYGSIQQTLQKTSFDLASLWSDYQSNTKIHNSEEYTATVGPGPKASNFAKANFLASLALTIHHPQPSPALAAHQSPKTIPAALVEWLGKYHDPYAAPFEDVAVFSPSPSNHRLFWGAIFNGILHGKMKAVVSALQNAGWRHARSGMDDMRDLSGQVGFTGQSLINIEKVANAAVQVLATCPGINGDWNVRGNNWTLFRHRASQSLDDLQNFAEGKKNRGLDQPKSIGTYSTIARKAESQVPWNIYQNFLTVYSLILGESAVIISNAQDWCEATIALVLWWDGGNSNRNLALTKSRASHRGPTPQISDKEAYIQRLQEALEIVTNNETDFQVNTLSHVEVGLASLMDGDNEAATGFLRAWSGPVSSAVAEVASLGGWLPPSEPQSLINMGSLDQDDMDLLGLNSSPTKVDSIKDQTLITYARALSNRGELRSSKNTQKSREGWELAIAVLGRLDSAARSEDMVRDFLNNFELDSASKVDKLWNLLSGIGMDRQAEETAEVSFTPDSYADLHSHRIAIR